MDSSFFAVFTSASILCTTTYLSRKAEVASSNSWNAFSHLGNDRRKDDGDDDDDGDGDDGGDGSDDDGGDGAGPEFSFS
ncbi:hypothetical protein EMCRGX_G025080 [Ephydatia muelleri]